MFHPLEIPDCFYPFQPTFVRPKDSTPRHKLYLSNLDDQKFLRFTIKYLYLFKKAISSESLKSSLSAALVHYYPLAGRLRISDDDKEKLQVDCNGEGALFSEAFVDLTAEEFLEISAKPDRSWRKLLYRVEGQSFLDAPLLSIQVTYLRCGGMILCTAINHCLADGIGTVQFLRAWTHLTTKLTSTLHVLPFHSRELLSRPPGPPHRIALPHHNNVYTTGSPGPSPLLDPFLQPMVPTSLTFTPSQILDLKKLCVPSLKCSSFEALAAHVWRTWVRTLDPSPSLRVKLLFSMNVRARIRPELPDGYYGNGFVLACAEAGVQELVAANLREGVRLVQDAKLRVTDEYVRSTVDYLEERGAKPDLAASLVISPWTKLGLEELDFGEGRPMYMGPMSSEIYCLFLPVVGDREATTVLMSMPANVVDKFEYHLKNFSGRGLEREHGQTN